jgi:nitrate/nitrite transporter NarK
MNYAVISNGMISPYFLNWFSHVIQSTMSASGDFGPEPPGVRLDETQNADVIGWVAAIGAIGIMAVILRVIARTKGGASLAIDDYFIIAALVTSHWLHSV